MDIKEKVISNSIYLFLDNIAVTLLSFLFWVLIGKTLPPEHFGIITTSTVIITTLPVLVLFGTGSAIAKLVSEYYEKRDLNKISALLRFSLKFILLVSTNLVLFLFAFSSFFSEYFKLSINVFYITIVGIVVFSFYSISGFFLYGLQNMRKIFVTNAIGNIFKILISILLLSLGFLYYGPILGFVISYFLIFLLRLEKRWFNIKQNKINKREVFKYSIPALIFGITSLVYGSLQYFILPILTNQYETGLFGIANKITYVITVIPLTLGAALFPTVSGLSVYQKIKLIKLKQEKLINLALRYCLSLSLPLVVFSAIFARPLIITLASEKYLDASLLFIPLAFASFFFGLSTILLNILFAIRKPVIMRNVSVMVMIIFLIFAFPFTIYFSALGMSYALLIAMLFMFSISFYYLRKFLKIEIEGKTFSKIILSNLMLLFYFMIIYQLPFVFLIKLILVIFGIFIYLLMFLFLKFYMRYDIEVLIYLNKKIPFFKKQIDYIIKILSKYVK
ncbi:MAG: oligosaccharide flippase family protein [Candidatus Aenigmatarchaeota archaeon]